MAHFARQKRQSRFYWAELGFIALGLLGLQPGLFTYLIFGSPSRSSSFDDSYYQVFPNQALNQIQVSDNSRDWPQTYLASYQPVNAFPSSYAQPHQLLYAEMPTYSGSAPYPQQQNYSPQSANYQQQLQYAQSMPPVAATYSPSSYPNALPSAYSGLAVRPTQQPLFDTSYNSNYTTGTEKTAPSAQNYSYQPNMANTSTWQRYRAPAPPIYR